MRHQCNTPSTRQHLGLLTVLFFCVIAPACDNTCFIFVSNPSGGAIAVGTSTCKLSNANGTVSVQLTHSLESSLGLSPGIRHIFISLRGIEAHVNATADEDSPDWQELVPTLKTQPLQVDLKERHGDSDSVDLARETIITAGTYSQVRMLLVPNQPAPGEPIPERNDCGRAGFNCIITSNGDIRSLGFMDGEPQIRITSEHINGGLFQVLPGNNTKLDLEFNLDSWPASIAGQAMRFSPMITVRSEFSVASSGPDPPAPILSRPENK